MSDINDLTVIDEFASMLPPHKGSLTVTHNQYRDYYQSVEEYLMSRHAHDDEVIDRAAMIANDSVWELQVYPETPVGSYSIFGPTLAAVILKARRL